MIEFEIFLINNKSEVLGIDLPKEEFPAKLFIKDVNIAAIRDSLDDEGKPDGCIIYTTFGETFYLEISTEEALNKLR